MFVCLFVCFSYHSRFFHMEMSPLPVKGCKCWPMLGTYGHWAVGFFAYHTYCDMRHPFITVISEDTWNSELMSNVWQRSCHYLFLRLIFVAVGIQTPNLPLAVPMLLSLAPSPRRGEFQWINKCISYVKSLLLYLHLNDCMIVHGEYPYVKYVWYLLLFKHSYKPFFYYIVW